MVFTCRTCQLDSPKLIFEWFNAGTTLHEQYTLIKGRHEHNSKGQVRVLVSQIQTSLNESRASHMDHNYFCPDTDFFFRKMGSSHKGAFDYSVALNFCGF